MSTADSGWEALVYFTAKKCRFGQWKASSKPPLLPRIPGLASILPSRVLSSERGTGQPFAKVGGFLLPSPDWIVLVHLTAFYFWSQLLPLSQYFSVKLYLFWVGREWSGLKYPRSGYVMLKIAVFFYSPSPHNFYLINFFFIFWGQLFCASSCCTSMVSLFSTTTPLSIGEVRVVLFTLPLLYFIYIEFYLKCFSCNCFVQLFADGLSCHCQQTLQGHPSPCWPAEISVPGVFPGTVRLKSQRPKHFLLSCCFSIWIFSAFVGKYTKTLL